MSWKVSVADDDLRIVMVLDGWIVRHGVFREWD